MKWSPQQDAALVAVDKWLKDPNAAQVFRIFGFAGTGKTTLAKHFADGIEGLVLYGAFTGKAAHVLRKMGCVTASTIHAMIYHSREKGRLALKDMEQQLAQLRMELRSELPLEDREDPEILQAKIEEHRRVAEIQSMIRAERKSLSQPVFALNPDSDVRRAKLVVIDECSMVDNMMGADLLSFGTKVLVLGDPAQLPPIAGAGFFTEGVEPDVMLTEIHRQAADSPIIAMATQIRQEKSLDLGRFGESMVVNGSDIDETFALAADQILVGRNKTRHASNRRMRELLGHKEVLPIYKDKLVCLRNNHDKGLLNGAIWHVDGTGVITDDRVFMSLHADDDTDDTLDVEAHTQYFLGRGDDLPWWERKEAEEFDYGYALTVHKAQGSQWPHVLLFDESWCFRKDKWRWLYTGLTRAADKVILVKM